MRIFVFSVRQREKNENHFFFVFKGKKPDTSLYSGDIAQELEQHTSLVNLIIILLYINVEWLKGI